MRGRVRSLLLDVTGIPHRDAAGAAAAQMQELSAEDFGDASPWAQGRMAPAGG